MSSRVDGLRTQVQEKIKQAMVQMDDARGLFLKTIVERVQRDAGRLKTRRDALLRAVDEQSSRLANQDRVALPNVVKNTLGLVQGLIGQVVESPADKSSSGAEHGVSGRNKGSDTSTATDQEAPLVTASKAKTHRPPSNRSQAARKANGNKPRRSRRNLETQ